MTRGFSLIPGVPLYSSREIELHNLGDRCTEWHGMLQTAFAEQARAGDIFLTKLTG